MTIYYPQDLSSADIEYIYDDVREFLCFTDVLGPDTSDDWEIITEYIKSHDWTLINDQWYPVSRFTEEPLMHFGETFVQDTDDKAARLKAALTAWEEAEEEVKRVEAITGESCHMTTVGAAARDKAAVLRQEYFAVRNEGSYDNEAAHWNMITAHYEGY